MTLKIGNMQNLLKQIHEVIIEKTSVEKRLDRICRLLKKNVPNYDWVGFYLVDRENNRELILGPYAGQPTEHTRIPFGRGICGQAAETEQAFIIDDVSKESNYLSCNINVKSEIVLPIFKDNKIIGELDLDSHTPAAFGKEDEEFLSEICRMVSQIL